MRVSALASNSAQAHEVALRTGDARRTLAASDIRYRAVVHSPASRDAIDRLLRETDAVADVHHAVRAGAPVLLQAS